MRLSMALSAKRHNSFPFGECLKLIWTAAVYLCLTTSTNMVFGLFVYIDSAAKFAIHEVSDTGTKERTQYHLCKRLTWPIIPHSWSGLV